MIELITGNFPTSHHVPKRAAGGHSKDFPFVTNALKESSKKNCAGRMLKTKGLRNSPGSVMMSLVRAFGGLVLGSLVQLHVSDLVK